MLQVATFLLPSQQDEANEFLKTHKPADKPSLNNDSLVVLWDDGLTPPAYEIVELNELIQSNLNACYQNEVSRHVLKAEIGDLESTQASLKPNQRGWDDIEARLKEKRQAIKNIDENLAVQELKRNFTQNRINKIKKEHGIK